MGEHLTNGQLAAYLDRRLGDADRQAVEVHLAECDACRHEVIESARLLGSARRLPRWTVVLPAAAAAAIAVVLLARPGGEPPTGGPVLREGGAEGVARVEVVTPGEGQVVRRGSVVFTWRSAGAGVQYSVTVARADGDVVWEAKLGDTTAAFPRTVGLEPGQVYYWFVDALFADGRSATSGAREFRVSP